MSTAQALSEGAARQSADLKLEVSERLTAVARECTADQRRRFRKALDRAANLLEREAPAILGFSPEGHPFAGLYSTIGRGNLLLVIAGPRRALALGMRVAEIDDVLAAARKFQEEDGGPPLPVPFLVSQILPTIIRSMDDVTLVPTQVTYTSGFNHERQTREEMRARLFDGREKATLIASGAMSGHPFIEHVKVISAEIHGHPAGGSSPWWLHLHFVRAGKQQRLYIERDFPTENILIAWGWYAIDLGGLPSDDINMHHHARDAAMWEEVSRRFHAVAKHTVWLDTTQASCEHWRRHRLKIASAA